MRRTMLLAAAGLLLLLPPFARATGPFLEVPPPVPGTNLLRNPNFESHSTTTFTYWSAAPQGFEVGATTGRDGSAALGCQAPDSTGWRGASQTLVLNRSRAVPLAIRGWSRAENVTGSPDSDYALYVDLLYQDGTPLWGQVATFATGTHDWQARDLVIVPEKPVKSLTLHCLFRNHGGRVWFDDVSIEEPAVVPGAVLFQGSTLAIPRTFPAPVGSNVVTATGDGLRLGWKGDQVVSVQVDGREVATPAPGGFLARDLAAASAVYGFADGVCAELGLGLRYTVQPAADHLAIQGRVTNIRAGDRAVMLLFALPVDAATWTWGDDIRRHRTISGDGEYFVGASIGCGTTGTMSTYPLATIHDDRTSLTLALDMAWPAVYRLVYHAGTRQFFLAFDFGLVPETARFPAAADFRFVVYRSDPASGFRAGLAKLATVFPEYYRVRATDQGIWMPFTDVSTVRGWEDFGFRFHEGDNNVAWDDRHGVLSFRYTEPMTWWMSMAPELPRTEAQALAVRDSLASGPAGRSRDMALVSRAAAMTDGEGRPALVFRNEPWANGAVWSLNPNPYLPASPNAATVYWNDAARDRYAAEASPKLDGEYLDSLEGYVTANLNQRRDHFAASTVPLTFASDSRAPALFKGLAIHEFTRWIGDDVHARGGLMFANSVPYRFGFVCPWLDVMGTETDWLAGGVYTPVSDAQLALWRSLSGQKPYLLLMNTDFARFGYDLVERYFLRALAYGMFPSMFSQNASENPYWQNPTWYDRDRPLFRKYLPLIRTLAHAGWQPVTSATFTDGEIAVERFGPDRHGALYFTLHNPTGQSRSGHLRVAADLASLNARATESVSGQPLARAADGWPVAVAPSSTAVVELQPAPRFVAVDPAGADRLRLTVAGPTNLPQILEVSSDLEQWSPTLTNTPTASPYSFEVTVVPGPHHQFLRLRW